jgi:anti-sigma factor RsiW
MTRACDQLHAFADGELPIAEVPAFERHLVTCPSCQEELESVMMLEALGYGISAQPPAGELPVPGDRPARRPRGAVK